MEEIKTLSFFGEQGISSASANHVANLAKEAIRDSMERLRSLKFYNESIGLIGAPTEDTISFGINQKRLSEVVEFDINRIATAHSLIAFLREAIKEKERKMKEAKEWTNEEEWKVLHEEYTQLQLTRPVKKDYPTEEDIRQEWSIGTQEKYLSLEAEAAAIGICIHEDGYLSKARIDLMNKKENPCSVKLDGSNTIIHKYIPTVSQEEVDTVYERLQKRHRSVQAELNGMKKLVEDEIANRKMKIDNDYASAMRAYELAKSRYDEKQRIFEDEQDMKRTELCKAVRDLKIVIPARLKDFYLYLTK